MVSKTVAQKQRKKRIMAENQGTLPSVVPEKRKSIHDKKTRPNMKSKMKVRLGMTSADIYEGFEDKKGVLWTCPACGRTGRVVGYCVGCAATGQPQPQQRTDIQFTLEKERRGTSSADTKKAKAKRQKGSEIAEQ